ncbi:Serine/threonine-protein kinase TOR [Linum grandiflorum]
MQKESNMIELLKSFGGLSLGTLGCLSYLARVAHGNSFWCYICLVEYDEGECIRVLPCHHEFHRACIDKWLTEIRRWLLMWKTGDLRDCWNATQPLAIMALPAILNSSNNLELMWKSESEVFHIIESAITVAALRWPEKLLAQKQRIFRPYHMACRYSSTNDDDDGGYNSTAYNQEITKEEEEEEPVDNQEITKEEEEEPTKPRRRIIRIKLVKDGKPTTATTVGSGTGATTATTVGSAATTVGSGMGANLKMASDVPWSNSEEYEKKLENSKRKLKEGYSKFEDSRKRFEKLLRWDDALRAYTVKASQASNLHLALEAILVLSSVILLHIYRKDAVLRQHWHDVKNLITCARSIGPLLSPSAGLEMTPMAANAAWKMREWDQMAEYVSRLDDDDETKLWVSGNTAASGDGSSNGTFFRAVLLVRRGKHVEAREYVESARKCLATELAALVLDCYECAYSNMVIDYCTLPVGNPVAERRRDLIRNMWTERIKGAKRKVEDILGLLTLWFNHGATAEVQMALQKGFAYVNINTWLVVLPQIIANNHAVRELIQSLLVRIGQSNPQASTTCIEGTLIRVAILWQEMWHEGLEEASRLFFGEHSIEGMLKVLEPLHEMLEEGVMRYKTTIEAYRHELVEALDCCMNNKRTLKEAELTQVGYLRGLGDRHPGNLMLHRYR